jgi:hypothetical protein
MPIIDRTKFTADPKGDGLIGLVPFDGRTAAVSISFSTERSAVAWDTAERILTVLRDDMSLVEQVVRDLMSRLGTANENTPDGRRKMERMLSRLARSDMTCNITASGAGSVYFREPRFTGHCIGLQFHEGGKLALATLAG